MSVSLGKPLGNPRLGEVRAKASASNKAAADQFAANVLPHKHLRRREIHTDKRPNPTYPPRHTRP